MTQTLYNLHTDGDQYRITKFVDGNPESSYLLTERECECPAGHRPTCRHRQMLPHLLAHNILNTHWFATWDPQSQRAGIVDFTGEPQPEILMPPATAVAEGLPAKASPAQRAMDAIYPAAPAIPYHPWRRL